MNYEPIPTERILAIDPISKGFGFVVIESEPVQLVDWGTAMCRRTADSLGETVRTLLARYQPTTLVLEDPHGARSETRRLALTFAVAVIVDAAEGICEVQLVPRESVLAALASLGVANKRQAVRLFAERFPELRPKVPPGRFIWQSEDARWAIFDALALAVAVARVIPPAALPMG
jgi:Holliday junction resolvasome RuvABC endonuclease subunit